jgi:hypothetical protein
MLVFLAHSWVLRRTNANILVQDFFITGPYFQLTTNRSGATYSEEAVRHALASRVSCHLPAHRVLLQP